MICVNSSDLLLCLTTSTLKVNAPVGTFNQMKVLSIRGRLRDCETSRRFVYSSSTHGHVSICSLLAAEKIAFCGSVCETGGRADGRTEGEGKVNYTALYCWM